MKKLMKYLMLVCALVPIGFLFVACGGKGDDTETVVPLKAVPLAVGEIVEAIEMTQNLLNGQAKEQESGRVSVSMNTAEEENLLFVQEIIVPDLLEIVKVGLDTDMLKIDTPNYYYGIANMEIVMDDCLNMIIVSEENGVINGMIVDSYNGYNSMLSFKINYVSSTVTSFEILFVMDGSSDDNLTYVTLEMNGDEIIGNYIATYYSSQERIDATVASDEYKKAIEEKDSCVKFMEENFEESFDSMVFYELRYSVVNN